MANDIEKKSEAEKPNDAALKEHKRRFVHAYRGEKKWREQKRDWQRFYDGDQLSDEEKNALEQRGQPEVVFNRVKPKVDGTIGIHLQSKTQMRAYDRGSGDFEKAKYITEALRYIEQQNQFEYQEVDAAEECFIQGRSWYKQEIAYEGLDVFIKNYHVCNDDIFLDPYSRKEDLSDAKDLFETVWMDLEDAIELFPGFEKELKESVNERSSFAEVLGDPLKEHKTDQYKQEGDDSEPGLWFDKQRRRVRIVTRYYRVPVRKEFALHEDIGLTDITAYSKKERKQLLKTLPDVTLIPQLCYKLNLATFCAVEILEEREDLKPWDEQAKFFHVLVPAYTTRDEKKMPYGLVKQMVDPQKEINKRRSKMLHLLNVNQIVMEEGAVEDLERARQEAARADGVLRVKPGLRFEISRNVDLAASQASMLQEAKLEIDEAGVSKEVQGNVNASDSGRAVQLKEQIVVRPLRKLFMNLRMAKKRLNILNVEAIQHYWKDEMLIKLTDDPEAQGILLNQRVVDPQTGEEAIVNDVSLGKYDLIIEEAPDTINLQSEQFDKLASLAQNKVPIPPEFLIEASSLPNKKKILEKMQQQREQEAALIQAAQAAQMQGQPAPVQ